MSRCQSNIFSSIFIRLFLLSCAAGLLSRRQCRTWHWHATSKHAHHPHASTHFCHPCPQFLFTTNFRINHLIFFFFFFFFFLFLRSFFLIVGIVFLLSIVWLVCYCSCLWSLVRIV